MKRIDEATRHQLLNKSKDAEVTKSYGTTRYERRNLQHIYNSVSAFNKIDMNACFKANLLSFFVPVQGEHDNYEVEVLFDGILDSINRELKNNSWTFEYKVVYRAIIDAINKQDIYISCTCLHPDTEIKLLDGTTPSVAEMKERFDNGEHLWVYSTDENGDFKPGEVEDVLITKETNNFIKITLDNDEVIITTPDHPYMLRDGNYKEAKDLEVGTSLMPLYFNYSTDYEQVKLNTEDRGWRSVYKLVAEELFKDEIEQKKLQSQKEKEDGIDKMSYDVAIHHKDFNKLNNSPENLQVMTGYEHWIYHANTISRLWDDPKFRDEASKRSREWMTYLNSHPSEKLQKARTEFLEKGHEYWRTEEGRAIKSDEMRETMSNYYTNLSDDDLAELNKKRYTDDWRKNIGSGNRAAWENYTEDEYKARIEKNIEILRDPIIKTKIQLSKCKRVLDTIIEYSQDLTEDNYKKFKKRGDPNWSKQFSTFESMLNYFGLNQYNHKIKTIENITLDSNIPVYDIKVKKWHNFLVNAGVILHNCPDWKYRMAYWSSKGRYNSGHPQVVPARITNPNDSQGAGCKHVMKVLADLDWALKLASCITNYVTYMEEHYPDKYFDIIFPALYGMEYIDAINQGIIEPPEDELDDVEDIPIEEPENDEEEEEIPEEEPEEEVE